MLYLIRVGTNKGLPNLDIIGYIKLTRNQKHKADGQTKPQKKSSCISLSLTRDGLCVMEMKEDQLNDQSIDDILSESDGRACLILYMCKKDLVDTLMEWP